MRINICRDFVPVTHTGTSRAGSRTIRRLPLKAADDEDPAAVVVGTDETVHPNAPTETKGLQSLLQKPSPYFEIVRCVCSTRDMARATDTPHSTFFFLQMEYVPHTSSCALYLTHLLPCSKQSPVL